MACVKPASAQLLAQSAVLLSPATYLFPAGTSPLHMFLNFGFVADELRGLS